MKLLTLRMQKVLRHGFKGLIIILILIYNRYTIINSKYPSVSTCLAVIPRLKASRTLSLVILPIARFGNLSPQITY